MVTYNAKTEAALKKLQAEQDLQAAVFMQDDEGVTEEEMLTKPRHGHLDMALRCNQKYREAMINDYHANRKNALDEQAKEGLVSDEDQMNKIAQLDFMDAEIKRMMEEEEKIQFDEEEKYEDETLDENHVAGLAAKNIV